MTPLRIEPAGPKHLRITGINPVIADCLLAVPEILEQRDSPAARQRLLPDPTPADAPTNADWQRLIAPELRRLFVTAGQTVTRDLTVLRAGLPLTFPAKHRNAWMSALNEARLILGERFKITEADMTAEDFSVREPKGLAVFRIHVLGYLLQLFVELEAGPQTSTDTQ
jgi:hypothetical protein